MSRLRKIAGDTLPSKNSPRQMPEESKVCSKCKRNMVIRSGRFGDFWACRGYPICRNTMNI